MSTIPGSPAIADQTRALLAVGAGKREANLFKVGDYLSYTLLNSLGAVVWESGEYLERDFPSDFSIIVPSNRRYRAFLVVRRYFGKHLPPLSKRRRFPFLFYPFKKGKKKGSLALILIKGKGSSNLRDPLLKTRVSLNRTKFDNPKRRNSGHRSGSPNQPVVRYSSRPRWNVSNGTGSVLTDYVFISYSRSQSGTTTPGFSALRKKRLRLPVNSYSMHFYSVTDGGYYRDSWTSDGSGSTQTQGGALQEQWGTNAFGGSPIDPGVDSSVDFRAIRKLIERVGPSNNIAQDFAQMGQTVNLITDTAKRIAAAVHDTRRGNFSGAAASLFHSKEPRYRHGKEPSVKKSLADNWLAFQYGWKPLLQDIEGSMESLARLNLAQTQTWAVKASASSTKNGRVECYQNVGGGNRTGSQFYSATTSITYGMRYRYDDHLTTFLAQTGFTNPINLAWEVLPYSFVVDWFVPIGPYLETFSAWDGLQFVDGWKSSRHEVINIWDISYSGKTHPLDPRDVQMEALGGTCKHVSFFYDRVPLKAFPSPKFPSFKNPVSVTHALNALALLTTAFHK